MQSSERPHMLIRVGSCQIKLPSSTLNPLTTLILRNCEVNMAAGHISKGSTFPSNSQQLNSHIGWKKIKSTCLYIQEGKLFWEGDYNGLKELIESDFNLSGKWLSSGRESKEFIHPETGEFI